MQFDIGDKIVKVNNGTGFFIDNKTVITAYHNKKNDQTYDIYCQNKKINLPGLITRKNIADIKKLIMSDDFQIISSKKLNCKDYYTAVSFSNENKYFLVGRRFRYSAFKHIENIKATILFVMPIELIFLENILKYLPNSSLLENNRIRQLTYCLTRFGKNYKKIQQMILQLSSLENLEVIYRNFPVSFDDALNNELSNLIVAILTKLQENHCFFDACKQAILAICDTVNFNSHDLQYAKDENELHEISMKIKNKLDDSIGLNYKKLCHFIEDQIVYEYYAKNNISFKENTEFLITASCDTPFITNYSSKICTINAPSLPGFSGGPLMNTNGEVQGIIIGGVADNLLSTIVPFPVNVSTIVRKF